MTRQAVAAAVAGTTAAALLLVVVQPRRCELVTAWVALLPLLLALAPLLVAAVQRRGVGGAALLSVLGLGLLVLAFDPLATYDCFIAG